MRPQNFFHFVVYRKTLEYCLPPEKRVLAWKISFAISFAERIKEIHTECCWRNLEIEEHLEDLGVDGGIVLKHMLKK
jgi:hypothetical protein